MAAPSEIDRLLVERIRAGDAEAWRDLIARYEGRLLAFAESRLGKRGSSEDMVQETFLGLLTSLPNYDGRRSLENYLFSICAYKLRDHLRREGRRPAIAWPDRGSGRWEPSGKERAASSLARSGERRGLEEEAIAAALEELIEHWRRRGDWIKLKCIELLTVRGWANKDAARRLGLSEQQVANFKHDFLAAVRKRIRRRGLPEDVFPELQDEAPSES